MMYYLTAFFVGIATVLLTIAIHLRKKYKESPVKIADHVAILNKLLRNREKLFDLTTDFWKNQCVTEGRLILSTHIRSENEKDFQGLRLISTCCHICSESKDVLWLFIDDSKIQKWNETLFNHTVKKAGADGFTTTPLPRNAKQDVLETTHQEDQSWNHALHSFMNLAGFVPSNRYLIHRVWCEAQKGKHWYFEVHDHSHWILYFLDPCSNDTCHLTLITQDNPRWFDPKFQCKVIAKQLTAIEQYVRLGNKFNTHVTDTSRSTDGYTTLEQSKNVMNQEISNEARKTRKSIEKEGSHASPKTRTQIHQEEQKDIYSIRPSTQVGNRYQAQQHAEASTCKQEGDLKTAACSPGNINAHGYASCDAQLTFPEQANMDYLMCMTTHPKKFDINSTDTSPECVTSSKSSKQDASYDKEKRNMNPENENSIAFSINQRTEHIKGYINKIKNNFKVQLQRPRSRSIGDLTDPVRSQVPCKSMHDFKNMNDQVKLQPVDYEAVGEAAIVDIMKHKWSSMKVNIHQTADDQAIVAEGWMYHGLFDEVVVLKRMEPIRNSLQSYLGKGIILQPPEQVYAELKSPLNRYNLNPLTKKMESLHEINNESHILRIYQEVEAAHSREGRVCTVLQYDKQLDGGKGFVVALVSVTWPVDNRAQDAEIVAKYLPTGWVIEPMVKDGFNCSMVTYVVQVDLKLHLSEDKKLLKELASRQPLVIADLKRKMNPFLAT